MAPALITAAWLGAAWWVGPMAAAQVAGEKAESAAHEAAPALQEPAPEAQEATPAAQELAAGRESETEAGERPWSPSFSAQGDSVWSLSYGWGDPEGLRARADVASRQLAFRQELRLRLSGEVAPGVSVSADLDNVRSENLQLIGIDLKSGPLAAHLGDIQLRSVGRYAVSQAALKGVSLSAELGDWTLTGVVGRAQGIPATKTFTGATSEERLLLVERLGAGRPPYAPAREDGGLAADLRGVEGLPLSQPYDAEFTRVWLRPYEFADEVAGDGVARLWPDRGAGWRAGDSCDPSPQRGRSLKELLTRYGLGDLYFEPGQPEGRRGVLRPWGAGGAEAGNDPARSFLRLWAGQATGVTTPGEAHPGLVLLTVETLELLQAHVAVLIRKFNEQNALTGSERLRYPLVRGSDAEREFLQALRAYFTIQAGTGAHPKDAGFQEASDEIPLEAVGTCRAFRERLGAGSSGTGEGSGGAAGIDAPLYLMGQTDVDAASVSVQARRRYGGTLQEAVELGLSWDAFPREGVLRVKFPEGLGGFLNDFDALVVRYRYTSSEGVYVLGTAVAAGSERVYLNGRRLSRDVDYTIDYETGVLMLLGPVGSADQLRVDFEYFRGGLGAVAEYHRNTFALGGRWQRAGSPWRFGAEVFFEGDEPRPLVEPERAKTMPESHTVAAISVAFGDGPGAPDGGGGRVVEGPASGRAGWFAELDLAFSHDVFPFDDNRRVNQPNRVEAIAGGLGPDGQSRLIVAGHRAGLTVGLQRDSATGPEWQPYDAASGLSGLTVYDVAAAWDGASSDGSFPRGGSGASSPQDDPPGAWILATESGLTVVANRADTPATDLSSSSSSPFDRTENWARLYKSDGLPDNDVRSVLFVGVATHPPGASETVSATLWVGTAKGLAWAAAESLVQADGAATRDVLKSWNIVRAPDLNLEDIEIRDLAFVPAGCTEASACKGAWVAAATPEGLLLVPVGAENRSQPFILDRDHPDLSAVAAVPRAHGGVRVFAGGRGGLWYGEAPGEASGIGWSDKGLGVSDVRRLQAVWRGSTWELWVASREGLGKIPDAGADNPQPPMTPGGDLRDATTVGIVPNAVASGWQVWAATTGATGGPVLWHEGASSESFVKVVDAPLKDEDPARFADIPASEHTRVGMAGRLAVGYGWEGGGLEAAVERVEPGFLPINGIQRQDVLRWNAGLRQRLTPGLTAAFSHADEMGADPQLGHRSRRLVDQLVADWTLPVPPPISWASPPVLRGELRQERLDDARRDGFELVTLSRTVTLREQLFDRRVTLGAGYERVDLDDRVSPARSYQAHNLIADLELLPFEGLRLAARYRRPLRVFAPAGEEAASGGAGGGGAGGTAGAGPRRDGSQSLELSAAATRRVGLVEAGLDVSQQEGLRLTDEGSVFDGLRRQAAARLSTRPLHAGAWDFTPSLRLRWQFSESVRLKDTRTGGETTVRARWVPVRLDVELGGGREVSDTGLPGRVPQPALKRSVRDAVRLSVTTEAWAVVRPTLRVEGSVDRSLAWLGATGQPLEALTRRLGATLQAAWKFSPRWPQESRLGGRWTEGPEEGLRAREWEAGHRLGFEPGGPWSFAASATGRAGEQVQAGAAPVPYWQVEVATEAGYRFSATWQGGVELGWLTGTRTPEGPGFGALSSREGGGRLQGGWARLLVRARF